MPAPPKARVDVDEDVDDLDDVLQQFSQPKPAKAPPAASSAASASTRTTAPAPSTNTNTKANPPLADLPDTDLSEDFARELTRGMESLMREIASEAGLDPDAAKLHAGGTAEGTDADKERQHAFRASWEAMLLEGMNGAVDFDGLAAETAGKEKEKEKEKGTGTGTKENEKGKDQASVGGEHAPDSFQSSIRRAMEKLKESNSNLQTDASTPDSIEALLSQLKAEGGGGESEDDLQGLLEQMMTELMSKDILYDPLKELHDKFPGYLAENASKISAEDKKRYDSQHAVVTKILAVFDDPTYSDQDVQKGVRIVELMNEMQSYGSPPAEIMGPLPPGLDVGPDGMPKLPEGCTIA
ncbi:Pex19 protein family-domain-containing protein [Sparassis latifolia]